jgi:hypothetical protein
MVLLTSLICNRLTIAFFFNFLVAIFLGIWGRVMYHQIGLENKFPMLYLRPREIEFAHAKCKRKICRCLATANQDGQKSCR